MKLDFIDETQFDPRQNNLKIGGLESESLFLGQGNQALEVVVFSSNSQPTNSTLHSAWKARSDGRAAPVLVAVIHNGGASLCGVSGEHPPIFHTPDIGQAKRLCEAALSQSDRNTAIRFLADSMPSLESELPGINNKGLISLHELTHGTRSRDDWDSATDQSSQVLGLKGEELVEALGFASERIDNLTKLLRSGGDRTALAVLLNENETPEIGNSRFNNLSPVTYALSKADSESLEWVLMVQGESLRLYNTKNIGVGRRGRTETYVECQPSLLSEEDSALLWLLFSASALKKEGSISSILSESKRFAADVAEQLRDRVYNIVVPSLALGIAEARNLDSPDKEELDLTYEMSLTVLFRLLFIAYAEDRDLLPYTGNESYRTRSLKNKSQELAKNSAAALEQPSGDHHWAEVMQLFKAVSEGNMEWGVPTYEGAIFSSDAAISIVGAELADITIKNEFFEPALQGLLLCHNADSEFGPIDFRALSVREFGTIYEGLLESELSLAEQNLKLDSDDNYIPANSEDEARVICVKAGEVYLHNRSGARKSSGSYYTRDFIVEYLLDESLEPAIDTHLRDLETLSEAEVTEQFFDFRVADIAMGSGHFLVAAIDRIERRFSIWLEANPCPGILRELQSLKESARKELGALADQVVIEDGQILRRMIARRCIYGVDLNSLAVQLTRLSIWIHTFVPGLPLSLLDHNFVHGNGLVGIGTIDEIKKKFEESSEEAPLFALDPESLLGEASMPLKKLAQLSDATLKDISAGRALIEEAKEKTLTTKALCDLITAHPVAENNSALSGFDFSTWRENESDILNQRSLAQAEDILKPLNALHFPIAFPEVFLGQRSGFNVILGNPPWDEAVINEDKFWARYKPGLGGMSASLQNETICNLRHNRPDLVALLESETASADEFRKFLLSGNFPGMGTGDPDVYKAFAWRFWFLCSPTNGRFGVVMPRSSMNAKGSADYRKQLFSDAGSINVTTLKNKSQWIFDISAQYTIVLLSISKAVTDQQVINIRGPYHSVEELNEGSQESPKYIKIKDINEFSDSVSLPLLPSQKSVSVLTQLRNSPRLDFKTEDTWRARPDAELHATNDKSLMTFTEECPEGFWKVYKGASFDLWDNDTGEYNAFADPGVILHKLQAKRVRANSGSRDSVHREFSSDFISDESTLAPLHPRIAFRDISRSTDVRTVRCALIPPKTFITNKGPVFLFPRGDKLDEAYLLGVLCSIPLDWYARRFVETNVNFFIINPFPIPRPDRSNPLWKRVVELSGRLAATDERFAEWATAVGVDYGPIEPSIKEAMVCELDAVVALLYDLDKDQLEHIFESFHVGWNHGPRLTAVLQFYSEWQSKI